MEKGLYLYCIRLQANEPIEVLETISGEKKVQAVPYMELEAITSEVSVEEFSSEEVQKKAKDDLEWIKGKVQIHEDVVERAMRSNNSTIIPVIPMQFGVIFRTKEKLQETLCNNLEKFRKSLDFLTGKQEWGVKVFLNQNVFGGFLEKGSEELLAKKKEAESLPKGMAFFAKKKIVSNIDEIKERELDQVTSEICESLSQSAIDLYKAKVLEKDFTLMNEDMILNGFYLIQESKIAEFKERTEKLREKYNPLGIEIEMTGPWPSYHFA